MLLHWKEEALGAVLPKLASPANLAMKAAALAADQGPRLSNRMVPQSCRALPFDWCRCKHRRIRVRVCLVPLVGFALICWHGSLQERMCERAIPCVHLVLPSHEARKLSTAHCSALPAPALRHAQLQKFATSSHLHLFTDWLRVNFGA